MASMADSEPPSDGSIEVSERNRNEKENKALALMVQPSVDYGK